MGCAARRGKYEMHSDIKPGLKIENVPVAGPV